MVAAWPTLGFGKTDPKAFGAGPDKTAVWTALALLPRTSLERPNRECKHKKTMENNMHYRNLTLSTQAAISHRRTCGAAMSMYCGYLKRRELVEVMPWEVSARRCLAIRSVTINKCCQLRYYLAVRQIITSLKHSSWRVFRHCRWWRIEDF